MEIWGVILMGGERENNLGFIISYILVDSLIHAMQGKVLQKYL